MSNSFETNDQQPLVPSGYWTGFYVYQRDTVRHKMLIMLDFAAGIISADGDDDVGAFTFKGSYDLKAMVCQFTKYYSKHSINYHGNIDENGIWGKWFQSAVKPPNISEALYKIMMDKMGSGGFHIWPSAKEFSAHELAVRQLKEADVVKLVEH